MRRRQPFPTIWLMTDERADAGLEAALHRLPRGAGVIFRHHATPPAARRTRYEQVRRIARARGLVLVLAGTPLQAVAWKADGAHGRSPHRVAARALLRTAPAHGRREVVAAWRVGAMPLLSPVFATRSHPGGRVLGVVRFGLLSNPPVRPEQSRGVVSTTSPFVLSLSKHVLQTAPPEARPSTSLRTNGKRGRNRVIALGGMTPRRYARLKPLNATGWAAIDAWHAPDF